MNFFPLHLTGNRGHVCREAGCSACVGSYSQCFVFLKRPSVMVWIQSVSQSLMCGCLVLNAISIQRKHIREVIMRLRDCQIEASSFSN
jgi:hypothetical protein